MRNIHAILENIGFFRSMKKIAKKVPQGTITLPGKCRKLIKKALLGCWEEQKQLPLLGVKM
jgi:hypothetical protein